MSAKPHHPVKPPKHEDTHRGTKGQYEHPDITDNRMVWEVLEETDE